jgi:predicted nucleotidyltransferase component of viral defense system
MIDRYVHKTILLQILKDIYTSVSLGPALGFKGGTAAHLFYDLGRFSVDLDFDLLDEAQDDLVFVEMESLLRDYGVIKEKRKKLNTLFFLLSYDERAQNIKVEINRRNFGSRFELKSYLGISMVVMVKADMFSHKLAAMLERTKTANRDVFDIRHFLKNRWPINKEIVEKRTHMELGDYLTKCAAFVEAMNDRGILAGIGELIDEKQKAWVKANLKKDTAFLLKVRQEQEK